MKATHFEPKTRGAALSGSEAIWLDTSVRPWNNPRHAFSRGFEVTSKKDSFALGTLIMLPNIRILLYFTILHSLNFVSVKIERARKSGVAKIGWGGEGKFGGLHAAAATRLIHINQSRNGRACLNAQIGARESDGQKIHAKFNFEFYF